MFKNYLFNMAYSAMSVLFPLIIMPYISRILLPAGLGKVAYAQNIVSYFILAASLGIPNYGIRETAKNSRDIQGRSQIFLEIFLINLISTFFASFMYYLLLFRIRYFAERRVIFCIVGISLILNALNIDWFYKGIEEFRYITIRSYIIKILSVLAIFLFVHSENDVNIYALILTLAISANYIFNIFHAKKYIVLRRYKINLKKHFRKIVYLFATAVAVELYSKLDITMVGLMCGEIYIGYYSNVMKIIRIVTVMITSLGSVLLPRLSVYYQEKKLEQMEIMTEKTVEYILFISLPCMTGVFLESEAVVRVLFGEAFLPTIVTMRILALLIPILSIGNIFGTQLLIALDKEKRLTVTVIIGAFINIVLNSFMIRYFQQNGAAIASVIAELAVMIVQILLVRPYIKVKFNFKLFLKIMIQTCAMVIVLLLVNRINTLWILKLVISVGLGTVIYFAVGLAVKNNLLYDLFSECRDLLCKQS